MSLDVTLIRTQPTEVFSANITHNLGRMGMAEKAGIYKHLWRPAEISIYLAGELIKPLETGLRLMKQNPEKFKEFNAENGWGIYEDFISWIEEYIKACKKYPDAVIEISR